MFIADAFSAFFGGEILPFFLLDCAVCMFLVLFICSALFPMFSRVYGENMLLKGHRDGYWTNKSLCLKALVTFCS